MKSILADIGIAAALALAFMVDEIASHKRLSAAVVALILAGLILPWWAVLLIPVLGMGAWAAGGIFVRRMGPQ